MNFLTRRTHCAQRREQDSEEHAAEDPGDRRRDFGGMAATARRKDVQPIHGSQRAEPKESEAEANHAEQHGHGAEKHAFTLAVAATARFEQRILQSGSEAEIADRQQHQGARDRDAQSVALAAEPADQNRGHEKSRRDRQRPCSHAARPARAARARRANSRGNAGPSPRDSRKFPARPIPRGAERT